MEERMISVAALSKPFAGEVLDIDLNDPIDDELFGQILNAWSTYPVLVFRNQSLDVATHQRFASRFGELSSRARPLEARGTAALDNPYMMIVSNIRENGRLVGSQGDGALAFHSDGAFNEIPTAASLLYGIEIPSHGGDTLFVSMYEVYESLAVETKQLLADKWAVNYHTYDKTGAESGVDAASRGKAVRHAVHPAVIIHPVTRRPVLYVNSNNTREIRGMDPDAATKLLAEIFAKIEQPNFVYAHKWRKGDLVIWDNRCLQHGRSDFSAQERRLMRRFAVRCDKAPIPYVEADRVVAMA
jgi:taurine dioxygenase